MLINKLNNSWAFVLLTVLESWLDSVKACFVEVEEVEWFNHAAFLPEEVGTAPALFKGEALPVVKRRVEETGATDVQKRARYGATEAGPGTEWRRRALPPLVPPSARVSAPPPETSRRRIRASWPPPRTWGDGGVRGGMGNSVHQASQGPLYRSTARPTKRERPEPSYWGLASSSKRVPVGDVREGRTYLRVQSPLAPVAAPAPSAPLPQQQAAQAAAAAAAAPAPAQPGWLVTFMARAAQGVRHAVQAAREALGM
jgi:hypothetical protein